MHFSHSGQLSAIVAHVEKLNPGSILDVGTGMGQYGFLFRTNLENVNLFEVTGATGRKRPRSEWRVRIEGIEGCAEYRTPVHDYAYDRVYYEEALGALSRLPDDEYDLVTAIDILEHFTHEDGDKLLQECKRVSRKSVLISTPKTFYEQIVEANPYENHRSVWSAEELAAHGLTLILPDTVSWIAATPE